MKKILGILFLAVLTCSIYTPAFAEETIEHGTGLAEMTSEEWSAFNASLPQIVDVKPNEIAISRLAEQSQDMPSEASTNYEVAELGDEMIYFFPGESGGAGGGTAPSSFELADSVDVSTSLTFPPIADQGNINSCVAWSLAYYQLTNNNCVVRGLNAKTASGRAVNENIMSPRFIYTLINGGKNEATYYDEACAAIMSYGCPNAASYSSTMIEDTNRVNGNLDEWCTDTAVWNAALYNKPKRISYGFIDVSIPVTAKTKGVDAIKRVLSNGYVVTIPTYVNSFETTRNTTRREWGCRYVSSTSGGGHAMTIVGYDDNFWVDINGNGRQNDGETGAFKIANSWGSNYYENTQGYIWMPYDALGVTSGVSGAPKTRISAFSGYYFIEPEKAYTPLLVAEVELTSNRRNQIGVELGISEVDDSNYISKLSSVYRYHIAFSIADRSYMADDIVMSNVNFSGGTSSQTVTIPFDLTPIIKYQYGRRGFTENTSIKFYIVVTDGVDNGSTVTLGNVEIVEPMTGKRIACTNTNRLIASNNSVSKAVDFQITPFVGYDAQQDLLLMFNSDVQTDSVGESIYLITPDKSRIYPQCATSGNTITVYSPGETGYIEDAKYELHIQTSVKSLGGNHLSNERVIPLYMLDDYAVWSY